MLSTHRAVRVLQCDTLTRGIRGNSVQFLILILLLFSDSDFKNATILTIQTLYKTSSEKKKVKKHKRRHKHCKYIYIYQQTLTKKRRAREAAKFLSPELLIHRSLHTENCAETSVEINDTLTAYISLMDQKDGASFQSAYIYVGVPFCSQPYKSDLNRQQARTRVEASTWAPLQIPRQYSAPPLKKFLDPHLENVTYFESLTHLVELILVIQNE